MRKNFGAKPYMYPMPVLIIGSYDENGVPNAMNAAWGGIADYKKVSLYLTSNHKTIKNILLNKEFTISIADEEHILESDYVGIVSGNKEVNKLEKAGLHVSKSELIYAPIIEEYKMILECRLISYDEESEHLVGEIVNVSADESVLDENGLIDSNKLKPIVYDPVHNEYLSLGNKVGNAFKDGLKLK